MSGHLLMWLVGNLVSFMRNTVVNVQGDFTWLEALGINLDKDLCLDKMVSAYLRQMVNDESFAGCWKGAAIYQYVNLVMSRTQLDCVMVVGLYEYTLICTFTWVHVWGDQLDVPHGILGFCRVAQYKFSLNLLQGHEKNTLWLCYGGRIVRALYFELYFHLSSCVCWPVWCSSWCFGLLRCCQYNFSLNLLQVCIHKWILTPFLARFDIGFFIEFSRHKLLLTMQPS